jgi:hemin uptake protein HemP
MADPTPPDARQSGSPQDEAHDPPQAENVRTIRSEDLFAGQRVVQIQHAGGEYRLLITRNNRLILQK